MHSGYAPTICTHTHTDVDPVSRRGRVASPKKKKGGSRGQRFNALVKCLDNAKKAVKKKRDAKKAVKKKRVAKKKTPPVPAADKQQQAQKKAQKKHKVTPAPDNKPVLPYSPEQMAAENDALPPDPTHPAVVECTAVANDIAVEYTNSPASPKITAPTAHTNSPASPKITAPPAKSKKITAPAIDTSWAKPGVQLFRSKEVLRWAMEGEIDTICKVAKILGVAALYDNDPDLYKTNMPSWQSRGHPRGLLGWGEQRTKGKTVAKNGALPELNRSCVIKAIERYFQCIGVPPVAAGITSKKAATLGLETEESPSPAKRGRSKKHLGLLPLMAQSGEDPVNFLEPFLLIVSADYCLELQPPIDDFTVAQEAILGFVSARDVHTKLLAQAKTCMSRFANKTLFASCLQPLYEWVREGNRRLRLECLMNFEEPDDDLTDEDETPEEDRDTSELMTEMAFQVVNALVLYSAGNSPSGSNKYGFFPYGKDASWSTGAFKKIPTAWFAMTFAEMYPFLFRDMTKWKDLRKKRAYPMTNLWPQAVVKRHLKFFRAFRKHRTFLFTEYEKDDDGIYHGAESPKSSKRKRDEDEEGVSSDDSMDLCFV